MAMRTCENKMSHREWDFYIDQLEKYMIIGHAVDYHTTKTTKQRELERGKERDQFPDKYKERS